MDTPENRFPAPSLLHPITLGDGSAHRGTVFLKAADTHPRMEVGDYTYASAHQAPADWAAHLAPYLYDFSPERLIIGKFCQIADGVQFITASANHRYDGISTFPFAVFGGGPHEGRASLPAAGRDTIIGHDVWIGQGAKVLPGTEIGNGVIVGAGAVASGQVPAYSVIAGNPARQIRLRFDPAEITVLQKLEWWHWPIEKVLENEALICGGNVTALSEAWSK
ncbi:CatB-related O-acetyltransferase [Sulfitobacter sp. F26169L]|uniref:CatB-related O-acetyltransferase n=1 Tax=Sulfitobacter sp. F26169L TaxID=2996015 RepID=UPI002260A25C|nr:CatB-related O-acetyltransferase [Sulfitobacter sp. F26169L]MCX7568239.1 CatB-related O-acetyltransferase [Sulfitobacter sp. F26169L]